MPETPDFDQLATVICGPRAANSTAPREEIEFMKKQLILIWNARGAADGAALKAELQRAMDLGPQPEASRPTINLEQMIKALDR